MSCIKTSLFFRWSLLSLLLFILVCTNVIYFHQIITANIVTYFFIIANTIIIAIITYIIFISLYIILIFILLFFLSFMLVLSSISLYF